MCISKPLIPDRESLEQFVEDSLHMYKGALNISKECGDEACILAIMALVKLHHFSRDYDLDAEGDAGKSQNASEKESKKSGSSTQRMQPKAYLVQALMLLEFLQIQSPHNYSASLLAVLLAHQTLALTSVAAEAIRPMGIKEVQYDTISHIFWNRIGITHPFPCMDDTTRRMNTTSTHEIYRVPVRGMAIALDWYDAAGDRMMDFMGDMLETIPFDKIDEFAKFKRGVEHSFSHATILLEARRIARLTGSGLTVVGEPLPSGFGQDIEDNRDWKTIPSFEYEETTEHFGTFISTRPR
jgi:N-acetyltransferase B complex (NatB) non catalytic subunit